MPGMEARAPERTETRQRVFLIAELLAGRFLPSCTMSSMISRLDLVVDPAAVFVILGAGLGGDGEALGNRQA